MPLSWNEIKDRAVRFSKEWQDESREHAEAKSFWDDFFNVFGISRRRVATFEEPVKKLGNKQGFIDLFWKGKILVEHKSKGKDLDSAYGQALDYFPGIKEYDLPQYVLVSDFARFRLYDLDEKTHHEFSLKELHKNIKLFGFIAGYEKRSYKEEDPVNIKAAELMGKLHDQLEESGYEGHVLEVYLVRLLFCLFADDTSIFERDIFKEYIEIKTREDGSDLGSALAQFFQVLNTLKDKRLKTLDEHLMQFPYVNGKLFEEPLPIAAFNTTMREILLECSALDWGQISPAIFGSLFQSIMDAEERRNLGAHYTSEKNILKLIKPLFLDELYEEFEKVKGNTKKLQEFHKKLASLKFLDPACGCGNFLVITYRELRLLELEVLRELNKTGQGFLSVADIIWIDVDQFYGIELDEWPARITEVAMWLLDHQMNMKVSDEFGQYFARLPLKKAAKIINDNALRIDWNEVVPNGELSYILGNPPFIGHHYQSREQKEDMNNVLYDIKASGVMDYVSTWYYKAAEYIQTTQIKAAFVSTNSISQGEQVSILWQILLKKFKLKIHFAHRTFQWNNEARGVAAVHVVIIGFANFDTKNKTLFDYETIKSDPLSIKAKNINPYLVDAPDILVVNRSTPLCDVPPMRYGNKPTDGGHFVIYEDDLEEFKAKETKTLKYIRPYIGSREFINNKKRWCLWLVNVPPNELKNMPMALDRVNMVKQFRENSKAAATRKSAAMPALFRQISQPDTDYIMIPSVSSERRTYIPIGMMNKDVIASNLCFSLPNATVFHFGVLTSLMHMTWVKYTCGRLKSDFRYSKDIVYNNYPWPKDPSDKNLKKVEEKAQTVLDVRAEFPESSLADLYDPLTMPTKLVKAHQALDKAVDLCYRPQPFPNEASRIEFLFDLYNQYTQPLISQKKKKR